MGYLSGTVLAPILAALIIMVIPRRWPHAIRFVAIMGSGATLALSLLVFFGYDWQQGGFQFQERYPWIPELGINLSFGVDGISAPMVLLTGLVIFTGVMISFKIADRPKEYYALLLVLVGGVFGVFVALDLFFFFFAYEIAVLPMYLLIAIWGSTRKDYAAMKLTIMLLAGSILVWVGLLALYVQSGASSAGVSSFDIQTLASPQIQRLFDQQFQRLFFPILFVGFAVLAAMWPFHTWSPDGHVAAPTAVSMLHAGVLMKLGAYGCIRAAVYLLPEGAAFWAPVFLVCGTIAAVYGAFSALAQRDFKFVIGYSSVSHMGYVVVGICTLSLVGMTGAVLQMFAHGIMTALFFALVGAIYDQAHTREIGIFSGLARSMPWFVGFFSVAGLASLGLPGLANFVAELLIFIGAFQTYTIAGVLCVIAVAITATYVLRLIARSFYGPFEPRWRGLKDMLPNEWLACAILVAVLLVVGLYPVPFIRMIDASSLPIIEQVGGVR
ncbi:MAG TPA: NADH-quinone oxidoreductase subunit M [Chloroflexota bacterium]|nr:NADH-quinone oxidoreductase subunit M [Chloroflexota bacterium]